MTLIRTRISNTLWMWLLLLYPIIKLLPHFFQKTLVVFLFTGSTTDCALSRRWPRDDEVHFSSTPSRTK